MVRTEIDVPEAETLTLAVPDGVSFEELVSDRQIKKDLIAQLEQEVANTDIIIASVLDLNNLRTVTANGFLVSRREGAAPRQTLSREKLLELGVAPVVIAQATVYGDAGRPGITIRRVKNGKAKAN